MMPLVAKKKTSKKIIEEQKVEEPQPETPKFGYLVEIVKDGALLDRFVTIDVAPLFDELKGLDYNAISINIMRVRLA